MSARLAIMLACLVLASCGRKIEEHPGQIQVWCRITSKTDSGERTYCGKACFQAVYVYTYECPQNGAVKQ